MMVIWQKIQMGPMQNKVNCGGLADNYLVRRYSAGGEITRGRDALCWIWEDVAGTLSSCDYADPAPVMMSPLLRWPSPPSLLPSTCLLASLVLCPPLCPTLLHPRLNLHVGHRSDRVPLRSSNPPLPSRPVPSPPSPIIPVVQLYSLLLYTSQPNPNRIIYGLEPRVFTRGSTLTTRPLAWVPLCPQPQPIIHQGGARGQCDRAGPVSRCAASGYWH